MAKDPSKTEKATPRRRQKAKEEGQVAKSQDIPISASLIVMFFLFLAYIPFAYSYLLNLYRYIFSNPDYLIPTVNSSLIMLGVKTIAVLLLPVFLTFLIVGIVSNIAQFGLIFSIKALKPKLDRINPISGIMRLLSLKTIFELFRNVLKLIVATAISYFILSYLFNDIIRFVNLPISHQIYIMVKYTLILILAFSLLSVPIAVIDFIYRKFEYEENIKMTKQEVKEERKMYEGNPQIKAAIRKKQRELSMLRMMAEVAKADVVITNPNHYAVALKYEKGKMQAPKVIAKGVDNIALKIKEKAKENKVPVFQDPPLARSLYKSCEIGDYIPENLYTAVAKILARIYKEKGLKL
ncbi:MAG: flagellar biosynthesis protein FlhB [Aquificae bacterium]|nr:flagellar biosynthesis protein FlhB [Aquificota bacterium]